MGIDREKRGATSVHRGRGRGPVPGKPDGHLTVDLDEGRIYKTGEDRAPNAGKAPPNGDPAPAMSTVPEGAPRTKTPSSADGDPFLAYCKGLQLIELKALCDKNGIEVSQTPANGGVLKMRHLNAVKAALKAGKALQK